MRNSEHYPGIWFDPKLTWWQKILATTIQPSFVRLCVVVFLFFELIRFWAK